jgi:hypothetical protein
MKYAITIFTALTLLLTGCKKAASPISGQVEMPAAKTYGAPQPEKPRIPPADGKYPDMDFKVREFDFGTIDQGDIVSHTFSFINNGQADLLISTGKGSCGCTVPEFPKKPVKPGGSGQVKVTFNSAHKTGMQVKTVTLGTNTKNGNEILVIRANINETVIPIENQKK